MVTRGLFLFAETSLHAGTGAELGAVDLPIQRERHTAYPIIHGSGMKGALRAAARAKWGGDGEAAAEGDQCWKLYAAFGPTTKEASKHAGCLTFTDARVVAFPVRAPGALFVWATCPDLLARLRRDLALGSLPAIPQPDKNSALVPKGSSLGGGDALILEEFAYTAAPSEPLKTVADWLAGTALPGDAAYEAWRERMKNYLVVLPDAEFQDIVQSATEVVTRVKLDPKKKTVQKGALWTEEALPCDTLLHGVVYAQRVASEKARANGWSEVAEILDEVRIAVGPRLQIGGDETTGRGWVSLRWTNGG